MDMTFVYMQYLLFCFVNKTANINVKNVSLKKV